MNPQNPQNPQSHQNQSPQAQNPELEFPIPLEWEVEPIKLYHKDREYECKPGYGGFRFYNYKSIQSPPLFITGSNGGIREIIVKDTISQSILKNNIVCTNISVYIPFCTSGMHLVIFTKNGKFYNSSRPAIRGFSDGYNFTAFVNEEGKLHSLTCPAYTDSNLPKECDLYFIDGVLMEKEAWFAREDVQNAIKMSEALD